jgi:hypothetical protein
MIPHLHPCALDWTLERCRFLQLEPLVDDFNPFLAVLFLQLGLMNEVIAFQSSQSHDQPTKLSRIRVFLITQLSYNLGIKLMLQQRRIIQTMISLQNELALKTLIKKQLQLITMRN